MLSITADDASLASRPNIEPERFVPVFLFFGKEDEGTTTIETFLYAIEIIEDRHGRKRLPFQISFNRSTVDRGLRLRRFVLAFLRARAQHRGARARNRRPK